MFFYFLFLTFYTIHIANTVNLKDDDIIPESSSSNQSLASSQVALTDYRTFERDATPHPSFSQQHHSHQGNGFKLSNERKRALRDFFTVLALSFHAVLEGLAIGLESESSDVWILFAGW